VGSNPAGRTFDSSTGENLTLVVAWIRELSTNLRELVVASDSRLRAPGQWDCCPKIFDLRRGDAVLAFAGWTEYGYPLALQAANAVQMYEKSKSRALDLCDLSGHLLRILNGMMLHRSDGAEKEIPTVELLLAGYSWQFADFRAWGYAINRANGEFQRNRLSIHKGSVAVLGDRVPEARRLLREQGNSKQRDYKNTIDMEPLAVLRDMCHDENESTIGGPPQVLKVYSHMNVMPLNVYWNVKNAHRQLTFLGRPLLDYETNRYLALDTESMQADALWIQARTGASASAESIDAAERDANPENRE
jgi:hypothetical protein